MLCVREVTDPEITSLWKVLLMELEPLKGLLVQIKQCVFLADILCPCHWRHGEERQGSLLHQEKTLLV